MCIVLDVKKTIILAACAAVALTGCASADTESDQVALVYSGGSFDARTFKSCVGSSKLEWQGMGDTVYYYPAGQRTYAFDRHEGSDTGPLTAPTKDLINLTVTGGLRFELNTSCDKLREFHEKIGRKDEWKVILKTYLENPLNRAITEATQGFNWLELYSDPVKKAEWEKKVLELLPGFIKQDTGSDYFGQFRLTLQKPELPQELNDSLLRLQKAIQDTAAQTEENKRLASVVDGTRAQIEMLGPDNYVLLEAIKSGRVTFMPIPAGSPVMVAPK